MEFSLLPYHRGEPPIPVPKTPYISKKRYDGGPWLSYPSRRGIDLTAWDGKVFDMQEYYRSESISPTPIADLESFFQTWLFFGLLSECQCIHLPELGEGNSSANQQELKAIVDRIYDATLVNSGEEQYVTLSADCLNSFLASARSRLSPDPEIKRKFYKHLQLCLSGARGALAVLPPEFNHAVMCSIAALGELLMESVNTACQLLGLNMTLGRYWGKGFLDNVAKKSMRDHGWCVSDIARVEAKYKSVQGLYVARMMDKSLPKRNHDSCTDFVCKYFQNNMEGFKLQHQEDCCSCCPLEVDSEELASILRKADTFPVLRFNGDLLNLSAEVLEVESDIPYIAISHVWADGLGNPNSNSLHRCKLHHLRDLATSIGDSNAMGHNNVPYIWLDTLCCPSQDGAGKQLGIEKIRIVYQQAKHVLVLDAGLMSYTANEQSDFEQLMRIFTSSWMRRLWTLQEGALAKSLYFQFADKAVSLAELMQSVLKRTNHMKYKAIYSDLWNDYQGLISFFHKNQVIEGGNTDLAILDQALQFRAVSVPTDEPLCIGTLLSLTLREILDVKDKSCRMQKVWEMIAAQNKGIPMGAIFFEEPGIDAPGWRWALQSLLVWTNGSHELLNTRILKWNDKRLGQITSCGLRVQYAGYRIKVAPDNGEARPQLWPGFPRHPEYNIFFRDIATGEWYRVYHKNYALLNQKWTEEEKRAHRELDLHPLHNVAGTGDSALLLNSLYGTVQGIQEALFGTIVASPRSESLKGGVAVRKEHIVMIALAQPQSAYIYDTLRRLAIDLRTDAVVEKHKEIYQRVAKECSGSPVLLKAATENSVELQASIEQIQEIMKRVVQDAASSDEKFVQAVHESGEATLESIWVWIYEFVAHDYVGEKKGPEQVWFVD